MLATVTLVVLAAAPMKLASPGFTPVNADAKLVGFFSDHFAQRLQLAGLDVVTQTEIGSLLGLERQRQLLGCADAGSSCLAELAGGLGVDGVIVGSVAKVGQSFVINVKIIGAQDARALATLSEKLLGEEPVVDWLSQQAPLVAAKLVKSRPVAEPVAGVAERASSPTRFGPWPFVVGAVGVAAIGAGVAMNVSARNTAAAVARRDASIGDVDATVAQGKGVEAGSWAAIGVGSAAVVAGVAMLVFNRAPPVAVSMAPMPGGAFVGLQGVWP